jgi:hypothetical protein
MADLPATFVDEDQSKDAKNPTSLRPVAEGQIRFSRRQ